MGQWGVQADTRESEETETIEKKKKNHSTRNNIKI